MVSDDEGDEKCDVLSDDMNVRESTPADPPSSRRNVLNARRSTFITDDHADARVASFSARKAMICSGVNRKMRKQGTAVAVQERGSSKHANVVRFLYCVSATMTEANETLVAVPRGGSRDNGLLFRSDKGRNIVEEKLLERCVVWIRKTLFDDPDVLEMLKRSEKKTIWDRSEETLLERLVSFWL